MASPHQQGPVVPDRRVIIGQRESCLCLSGITAGRFPDLPSLSVPASPSTPLHWLYESYSGRRTQLSPEWCIETVLGQLAAVLARLRHASSALQTPLRWPLIARQRLPIPFRLPSRLDMDTRTWEIIQTRNTGNFHKDLIKPYTKAVGDKHNVGIRLVCRR